MTFIGLEKSDKIDLIDYGLYDYQSDMCHFSSVGVVTHVAWLCALSMDEDVSLKKNTYLKVV